VLVFYFILFSCFIFFIFFFVARLERVGVDNEEVIDLLERTAHRGGRVGG
jgi:hypothetical protein